MKTKIVTVIVLLMSLTTQAQDKRYIDAMQKNILGLYRAGNAEEMLPSLHAMERIAEKEKTKWEPYYYVSFGYVILATMEKDAKVKDANLDLALAAVNQASSLSPHNSEITAMEGFVHMIRISVDPGSRGQAYSAKAFQAFNMAVGENPNNPRALALLGQMQYGTANFFGSSTAEACETTEKALAKFDEPNEDPIAPAWGKQMAEDMLKQCSSK